jgi:hypothetical protein
MIEGARRRLALLAAGAAAALMLAAGCGGDDGDEGGTTAAPGAAGSVTLAEFVEQGNAICKEGNEEIGSGIEEFAEENGLSGNDQPSQEQIDALAAEVLIPSIADQVEELRALGTPEGEKGKAVERFLDNAESTLEEVEADTSLITGGKMSPFAEVNQEAVSLGLVVCAQEI